MTGIRIAQGTILSALCFLFSNSVVGEHPVRETISLDGQWEIVFDHHNAGKTEAWHLAENFGNDTQIRVIRVPSSWETIEQDYEGVAWFRCRFQVPETWREKVIRLQFGAVNYLAEVWINDRVVGYHEGGFTPFEFRVDGMVNPGEENVLTMRVVGPIILSDKSIDGMGKLEMPSWRGGIAGGVWQSVQLVATGEGYFRDLFIQPDIHNSRAVIEIEVDQTSESGVSTHLEITIMQKGHPETAMVRKDLLLLQPGINRHQCTLEIKEAIFWSPENPVLYETTVKLVGGNQVSDHWSTNFGMREFTIRDKDFYLNGEKIFIKAAFFEGLYPNGIAYPDSEEMARKEIRLAREAGFNMIRPWRHPPAPMWLDLADEMGILVVGSPALECMALPLSTPYLPMMVENEITQAILRDRNRASVVQWELFNELHRPVLKQMMRPMALKARSLDPTRLILDESGGWAHGANIYLPGEYEPLKFNDIHTYPGPFINKRLYDGFLAIGMSEEEKREHGLIARAPGRNVVPGLMSFISELGYGSLPDLGKNNIQFAKNGNPLTPSYRYHKRLAEEQEEMLRASGFDHLYDDISSFCIAQQQIHGEANKRMIEAARSNPEVDGYCVHALTAGDWILGAGLLDLWRDPKTHAYDATGAANLPRILAIRVRPRNVFSGNQATLEITGINELERIRGKLHLTISDHEGKIVRQKQLETGLEKGVSSLFEEPIETGDLKGTYRVEARFLAGEGEQVTSNSCKFDVFRDPAGTSAETSFSLVDMDGTLSSYFSGKGISTARFGGSPSVPVIVSGYSGKGNLKRQQFKEVMEFVLEGGTALLLDGVTEQLLVDGSLLPFQASLHRAKGLWTCIPHLVRNHPIFEGLPSGGMMRDIYENVWAQNTVRDIYGQEVEVHDPVVASVGFDWFSRDHKLHYSGPGTSWWGADVAVVTVGRGKLVISQLRLLDNLGKDPVADMILFNMINFSGQL